MLSPLLLLLLQHQLDYLGLPPPPRLPSKLPLSNPYLFVHRLVVARW